MEAARERDLDALRAAAERGDSIDRVDECGRCALWFAVSSNDLEITRWLVKRRATLTPHVLDTAVENASLGLVEFLLDHGADPNLSSDSGTLATAMASRHDGLAMLRLLLARGAKVGNAALVAIACDDQCGRNRLAAADVPIVVQLLIDAGADPNALDICNWTALHWAVIAEDLDVVRVLLRAGAAATIKMKDDPMDCGHKRGTTARDLAVAAASDEDASPAAREILALIDAERPDASAPKEFDIEEMKGFARETYAVLVAGRLFEGELAYAEIAACVECVHQWAARLRKPLACIPAGDLSEASRPSGDETQNTTIVVGLEFASASANEAEPTRVKLEAMRAAVRASEDLPAEFWADVSAALGGLALPSTVALHVVACGPLPTASLCYGLDEDSADSEHADEGFEVFRGQDMQQEPHSGCVRGVAVAVSCFCATVVDVSTRAHRERAARAKPLGKRVVYALVAQFD